MGFYKCINGYVCIKNVSKFGRSKISQSVRFFEQHQTINKNFVNTGILQTRYLESKCDGKVYKSTTKANIPYGGYAFRDFCLESELFLEASLNDSYFSLNVDFTTDNENSNDCRNANCIAIAFGPSEAIRCTSQPL